MTNIQNPTYFLAPNWNYRPGGRIAIGNIIVNPLKPHLPLTKADPTQTVGIDISRENNRTLSVGQATNLDGSLWATFLEKISIGVSANRDRVNNSQFTMSALETSSLSDDPSPESIKARCNDPAVKEYMRLDSMLCKPVYMVTGIKVAKDFKLEGEKSRTNGFSAEASGEVVPEVSIGAGGGVQRTNRVADAFEADSDIIFAYQLIKIKPRGWSKEKTFKIEEYQHSQAFLGDDKNIEDDDVDGELEVLDDEHLQGLAKAEVLSVPGATIAYEPQRASN